MTNWHPWIVHYPIALLPVGVLIDIAAILGRRSRWHTVAYSLLVMGTLAAAAAVISGNEAALPYRDDDSVNQLVLLHENYGSITFVTFLVISLGRLPLQLQGRTKGWPLRLWIVAGAIGCGILWTGSFYGGELVYEHGVGVRRDGLDVQRPSGKMDRADEIEAAHVRVGERK